MTDAPTLSSPLANPKLADPSIPPHNPTVLWIGCSDARVPESVWNLTPPPPPVEGQIFVHRNIANQFQSADVNAVSVLTYGATALSIKEVRVVGHTDCGGVKACYDRAHGNPSPLPVDSIIWTWLKPLRDFADANKNKDLTWLTQENVRTQMRSVKAMLGTLGKSDVVVKGYLYDVAKRSISDVLP